MQFFGHLAHTYYTLRGARQLQVLVLKPTYRCTANCVFCEYRKELAAEIFQKNANVSIERWLTTIRQAHDLGAKRLVVSGGEPLLYKEIDQIFRCGRELGMQVGMNTNGSLIKNQEKADYLRENGLDFATISLDSYDPDTHDRVRRVPGLWQRAVDTIGYLQRAGVTVNVHTIMSRHQYQTLDRLFALSIQLGAASFQLCQVEADHKNRDMLMSVEQIEDFKQHYVPKLIRIVNESDAISQANKAALIQGFATVFPDDPEKIQAYSQGRYGGHHTPGRKKPCLIPYYFSLILEDGSVLPCNAVEYTHAQTVGNILEQDYTDIWTSQRFDAFRISRMDWCQTCPMQAHQLLPLMQRM